MKNLKRKIPILLNFWSRSFSIIPKMLLKLSHLKPPRSIRNGWKSTEKCSKRKLLQTMYSLTLLHYFIASKKIKSFKNWIKKLSLKSSRVMNCLTRRLKKALTSRKKRIKSNIWKHAKSSDFDVSIENWWFESKQNDYHPPLFF